MNAERGARVLVGAAGCSYGQWKGAFYPDDLPEADWLRCYTRRLRAVEINRSFCRLPQQHTLRPWAEIVPGDFHFAAKASRYITHMKKVKDAARS